MLTSCLLRILLLLLLNYLLLSLLSLLLLDLLILLLLLLFLLLDLLVLLGLAALLLDLLFQPLLRNSLPITTSGSGAFFHSTSCLGAAVAYFSWIPGL